MTIRERTFARGRFKRRAIALRAARHGDRETSTQLEAWWRSRRHLCAVTLIVLVALALSGPTAAWLLTHNPDVTGVVSIAALFLVWPALGLVAGVIE